MYQMHFRFWTDSMYVRVRMCAHSLRRVWLFATPWIVARQTPLYTGFPGQEYLSGLPFLLQGIFQTLGSKPHLFCLLHRQADSLPLRHLKSPQIYLYPVLVN